MMQFLPLLQDENLSFAKVFLMPWRSLFYEGPLFFSIFKQGSVPYQKTGTVFGLAVLLCKTADIIADKTRQ